MIFPEFEAEWYRQVGYVEAVLELPKYKHLMHGLCLLADGLPRKSKNYRFILKWVTKLSSFSVVDCFMNGKYQITQMGLDVVYATCKLNIPKENKQ